MGCVGGGALSAAVGGGGGYVFGLCAGFVRNQGQPRVAAALAGGRKSGKTFGLMGGVHTAAASAARAIRGGRDDAWNGAVGGCATGVALAWDGGVLSALQSCATLGALSYIVEPPRRSQ